MVSRRPENTRGEAPDDEAPDLRFAPVLMGQDRRGAGDGWQVLRGDVSVQRKHGLHRAGCFAILAAVETTGS